MSERYVLEALQKAVISAVAASNDPSLPIRMIGRTLQPPADDKWLEVIHIPNNSNYTWGSEKTYKGMLRLILHWPTDDKGAYAPFELMESIVAHFAKGTAHGDDGGNVELKINKPPMSMGVVEQAPEQLFPYSIQYRCYTP